MLALMVAMIKIPDLRARVYIALTLNFSPIFLENIAIYKTKFLLTTQFLRLLSGQKSQNTYYQSLRRVPDNHQVIQNHWYV
jgi:hypothetical protein